MKSDKREQVIISIRGLTKTYKGGHEENADSHAAKNIHTAGHAVLACGGDVRPSKRTRVKSAAGVNQEPTEAIQAVV